MLNVKSPVSRILSLAIRVIVLLLWSTTMGFPFHQNDQHIFTYRTDREVDVRIFLAVDKDELPDHYYCDLFTPICLEDLCNPIEIRLEWDLLGNFRNYQEVKGKEITKFDHEPFEEDDHKKLKEILSDKESLLQDYHIEDLVDTTQKVYSAEIDGLTAATSKTFADKLVPGAIYTCYTLWHIINGEIADKILAHTQANMSEALKRKMLLRGSVAYQDFVLDRILPEERKTFQPELFELIDRENPFIAIKSIRHLPDPNKLEPDVWKLIRNFDKYVLPVRSAIIQYFTRYPCNTSALKEWVQVLGTLSEQQKVGVYGIFEKNKSQLDKTTIAGLKAYLERRNDKLDGHDRKLMLILNNL